MLMKFQKFINYLLHDSLIFEMPKTYDKNIYITSDGILSSDYIIPCDLENDFWKQKHDL